MPSFLVAAGLALALYCARSIWLYNHLTKSKLPVAPLDEATFLLGHEYSIAKRECGTEYSRYANMLGPLYRIKAALFQPDIIVVSDRLAVQHITQNAYSYSKSPVLRPIIATLLGRGVLWAEGDEHRVQRKLLAPAFTPSATRAMASTVMQVLDKTIHRFNAQVESSRGAATINLPDFIAPCIFEIVGRVGFNHDFGYDTPETRAILGGWKDDVKFFWTFAGWVSPIVISIFPWITNLPIKALHEDSIVKKHVYTIGRQMLKEYESTGTDLGTRDIFSVLMRESEGKIDHNTLLDNIVTFLVVGHETTAKAIEFTLYDLAQNLEVQGKLREELASVDFNLDSLEDLPYLDAVTREGLRLHPAARDTERVALKDDVIPLQKPVKLSDGTIVDSFSVKEGDKFILPFATANKDPAVWGFDADRFVPERWLGDALKSRASELPRGPYANILSFLDGPRMCIGWRLAVMEVKLVVAGLIKSFEFQAIPGVKVERYSSPALQPFVNGEPGKIPVRVTAVHL